MLNVLTVTWLVRFVGLYLLAGLVFGVPFVIKGAGRIDPAATEGTRGFRILILPGVIALWPLLVRRWLSGKTEPPQEHNAHRDAVRQAGDATEAGE